MNYPNFRWKDRWQIVLERIRVVHSEDEIDALLAELVNAKSARMLGFVNAHAMNSVATNSLFFNALSKADVLLRDGSGMALLYRKQALNPGINMNGTDFIPRIFAAFRGRRAAFWGTEEPFNTNAAFRCEYEHAINVVSVEDGFKNFEHYVDLAIRLKPDLIVLGMGMPRQEQLANLIRSRLLNAPLIICGGAILDFLGGKVDRAPLWMRKSGTEWIYRLGHEPQRLFRRYVIGNQVFIFRLLGWRNRNAKSE